MAGGSMNRFYLLIATLAVVGGGVLYYLSRQSKAPAVPIPVSVQPGDTAGFRGYVLGPDSGAVEIVEYADYQCPACQTFGLVEWPYVRERLIATGRVRFVYRDFPLDGPHRWARLAAHAAACADEQGQYWEMHDHIYETQGQWSPSRNAGSIFREQAGKSGLDLGAYDACMSSGKYAGRIQASFEEGARLGVNSTPSFIIGGRLYAGVQPYDRIRALVDSLSRTP